MFVHSGKRIEQNVTDHGIENYMEGSGSATIK